ncbi:MAG: hypothetical protein RL757_854 [Bacteroidota bacterium]
MQTLFLCLLLRMKIYFNLVEAVADALLEVFDSGRKADKVIEKLLRSNPKWGSRDRAFIAEQTYECVRWWRRLRYFQQNFSENNIENSDISRAEILEIIGINLQLSGYDISQIAAFEALKNTDFQKIDLATLPPSIQQSIPDWLDQLGRDAFGEPRWTQQMTALNQTAPIVLRTNFLKTTATDLQKNLSEIGWETIPVQNSAENEGFYLKKRANVFATDFFKNGLFEVQDAGSQAIGRFLQVKSGMRVVDACAGAGGKALHLATLMQNKGRIVALDIEGYKLEELKRRARRNGIGIIETRVIESTKTIKRLHDSADRLLLDVPCSGLGVLRRNPDAKWKLKPEFIEEIKQTQQQILQNYSKILRVGGLMVYATCSILPSENEHQVALFLKNNPNFKQLDQQTLSPADANQDGFFMALLSRES